MANDKKKWYWSLLILFLFVFFISLFNIPVKVWYKLCNEYDYWVFSILGSFGSLLASMAALINLIIIIKFYNNDRTLKIKEQNDNKASKLEEQRREGKLYWYRNVILNKHMEAIDDFFNESINIIHKCHKIVAKEKDKLTIEQYNKEIRTELGNYIDKKMDVNHKITDMIRILDDSFGQELDDLIMRFQDEFTDMTSSNIINDKSQLVKMENKVIEQKKIFLKKLYEYEIYTICKNM